MPLNPYHPGPEPTRNRLPRIYRHALWHPETGLIVSPFGRVLPAPILDDPMSTSLEDYMKTRVLNDGNVYLAFYPRNPIHRSPLFSALAIGHERFPELIKAVPVRDGSPQYMLAKSVQDEWIALEDALWDTAQSLIMNHPNANTFPPLHMPKFPWHYGYKDVHATRSQALACAKRSREAFRLLSALVTFALSVWLTEYEDDCLDGAFTMLETRQKDPIPRVWLDMLMASIVCDFSPGLRPGGFLDPFHTLWGPVVHRFSRARVPMWFIWGHDYDRMPLDTGIRFYLPPSEIVEAAKVRRLVYSTIVHPHVVVPHADTYTPPPEAIAPSRYDDVHEATRDLTLDEPPPLPPVDRTMIVHAGSYQRAGETWEQFFERMKVDVEKRKANETDKDRQSRLSREAYAAQGHCSKTATVFEWERDEVDPTFWRRTQIPKKNIDDEWDDYSKYQRIYWSHLNQWDLCPQLPETPLGAKPAPSNNAIADMEAEEEYLALIASKKKEKAASGPVGAGMLRTVRAAITRHVDPAHAHFLLTFPPFDQYLRRYHGFNAELEESWHETLHSPDTKLTLKRADGKGVLIRLMYGTVETTLQECAFVSMVDFYNILQNAEVEYWMLPRAWDLSPDSATPLFCDTQRVALERVKTPTQDTLYVLRPPPRSKDSSSWFIATTSAITVLFVYRSRWVTMSEICRGLLEQGIPFRTVVETQKPAVAEHPQHHTWKLQSRALGLRRHGFVPTNEDFMAYEDACERVLRSPLGRSIRLRGGLVGRIACETVPDIDVLDGPSMCNEVVGVGSGTYFVDDKVDDESLDIVCGVFHVKDKPKGGLFRVENAQGRLIQHSSFWPRHWHWMSSGYANDRWSPASEEFYQKQLSEFAAKRFTVRTGRGWKDRTKLFQKATNRTLAASERLAVDFLEQRSGTR